MKGIQHSLSYREVYIQHGDLKGRGEDIADAPVVAQEWQHIQYQLLLFARTAMQSNGQHSIRQFFEIYIEQCANRRASMRCELCSKEAYPDTAQLVVVSFPPTCYGVLTLVPGFLLSPFRCDVRRHKPDIGASEQQTE